MRRGIRGRIAALLIGCCASLPSTALDTDRADVSAFIDGVVARHRLDRGWVRRIVAAAETQQAIIDLMQRPAERVRPWFQYRDHFLTAERIDAGVAFWTEHRERLAEIAGTTGVAPHVIIGILGVETFFGRITGRYRVLDALATLGFDYPPRGEFFRQELEQFLMMTREEKLDPRAPLGSYAGAMGIPQFMPSSFRRFAVDGTGDGHRNLWEVNADVYASVGNYLRENGWRAGQPVLAEAYNDHAPDDPANAKLVLNDSVESLKKRGYVFQTTLPDTARVMLVPAQLADSLTWRVGLQNFYAITRYNRSPLYAMAVNDLAQQIAERYRAAPAALPAAPPAAASPAAP